MKIITGSKLGALRRLFKTNPVLALIKAGKTVLENAKWTRDEEAKTADGKNLPADNKPFEKAVIHEKAGSFCAIGAVRRGQYELIGTTNSGKNFRAAQDILDEVAGGSIVDFNDTAKKKVTVLKKFDEAIATGGKKAKKAKKSKKDVPMSIAPAM